MAAHYWGANGPVSPLAGGCKVLPDLQANSSLSEFHLWRMLWTPDRISIYVDPGGPPDAEATSKQPIWTCAPPALDPRAARRAATAVVVGQQSRSTPLAVAVCDRRPSARRQRDQRHVALQVALLPPGQPRCRAPLLRPRRGAHPHGPVPVLRRGAANRLCTCPQPLVVTASAASRPTRARWCRARVSSSTMCAVPSPRLEPRPFALAAAIDPRSASLWWTVYSLPACPDDTAGGGIGVDIWVGLLSAACLAMLLLSINWCMEWRRGRPPRGKAGVELPREVSAG